MSDAISVHAERKDDGFWTYLRRSAGELPGTPLHNVLEWVLEQLNFGNFETERDSRGDVVSVTIGKAAAGAWHPASSSPTRELVSVSDDNKAIVKWTPLSRPFFARNKL